MNISTGECHRIGEYGLKIREIARIGDGKYLAICRTDANHPDGWKTLQPEEESDRKTEWKCWKNCRIAGTESTDL